MSEQGNDERAPVATGLDSSHGGMVRSEQQPTDGSDRPDRDSADASAQADDPAQHPPAPSDREATSKPDPDAPGNYVDDPADPAPPEPNEPA